MKVVNRDTIDSSEIDPKKVFTIEAGNQVEVVHEEVCYRQQLRTYDGMGRIVTKGQVIEVGPDFLSVAQQIQGRSLVEYINTENIVAISSLEVARIHS